MQLAKHSVEEMAQRGDVPVSAVTPTVVVLAWPVGA